MFRFEKGSLRLFRVADTDVFLHWSWLILAFVPLPRGPMSYSTPVWRLIEYVALFGMVLLHEFGHVLGCRQVGGTADRIILWPLGGLALVMAPERPLAFLWTMMTGPLVNLVLVPLTIALCFLDALGGWAERAPDIHFFVWAVTAMNIGLLLVNLLPVFPLDGGQILHALLWLIIGRWRSLAAVTVLGFATALGVGVLAASVMEWGLMVLACFGIVGCLSGFQQARHMLVPKGIPREGLACPSCRTAPLVGPSWLCEQCWRFSDVFAVRTVCPHCGARFPCASCLECGQGHPLEQWGPTVVAAPAEDTIGEVLPAAITDGPVPPLVLEEHLNAASFYREAFTLLPQPTAAEVRVLKPPSAALTRPLNETTLALVQRSEPALEKLRQGAARTACDWADSPEHLQRMGDDEVTSVRRLCEVTCLRARLAFRAHEGPAALEDLTVLLVMARQFGRYGPTIARLMQLAAEALAIDLAGAHLLEQNPSTLRDFAARLKRLPEAGTLMDTMRTERRFMLGTRPKVETREEALVWLGRFCSPPQTRAILKVVGPNISNLSKMYEETARLCEEELGPILMLPREQFREALAEFVQRHWRSNPLAVWGMHYFNAAHYAATRGRTRMDMLKAAVSIACDGNWRKDVRDRPRIGTFKCRTFKAGFELEAWFVEKPPITLVVGKKPGVLARLTGI